MTAGQCARGLSLDDLEFYRRFRQELRFSKESFELPTESRGFAAWLGTNYFKIDDKDECRNSVCDGGNDQGIDGVFFNEDEKIVEFVQTKVPEEQNLRNAFPENQIIKTLAGVDLVTTGDFIGKVAPELEDLCRRYHDLVNNSSYGVRVNFFSLLGPPASMTHVDHFHQKSEQFRQIEVRFQGFAEMKAFFEDQYLLRRLQPPEKITFQAVGEVLFKTEPKPSAVFTIQGAELAKNVLEQGAKLFQDNVRLFLGSSRRSTNIRIRETAESDTDSSFFWYYNNGINIVCKQIELPASRKVITLHRPQIVNGAQTSYALAAASEEGKLKANTMVLVKAVQESDRGFIQNLTLYTNSQNPVRLRDFASNDQEQIAIGKICRTHGFFYEKKRGEFQEEFPTEGERQKAFGAVWREKVIDNETAAQYYMAWELQLPAEARRDKRRIFSKADGDLYYRIFHPKIIAESIVFLQILGSYVEHRASQYREIYSPVASIEDKEALSDEEKKRTDAILRDDFLNHGDLFLIALMKFYLADTLRLEAFNQETFMNLIERALEDPALFDDAYNKIVEDLRPFFDTKRKDRTYYHNKFFKNENAFGEVRGFLQTEQNRTFVKSI